jgi:CheY-like chemotaxis protein
MSDGVVDDGSKQIVVVDDDADLRYLTVKRLRAAGWQPLPAGDGIEAVRQILAHPKCRRMLTDFVMPTFGGDSWILFLERFLSDWTIVVMSSEDIDPGRFISLPKPIDIENLLHVFERERS